MTNIDDGLLYLAHIVTKQIDGYRRQCVAVTCNILGIGVVNTQILAETQRLRRQPSLLQLNEYQPLRTVIITDGSTEVNAKHRQGVALRVDILMRPHLDLHNVLLQQC